MELSSDRSVGASLSGTMNVKLEKPKNDGAPWEQVDPGARLYISRATFSSQRNAAPK